MQFIASITDRTPAIAADAALGEAAALFSSDPQLQVLAVTAGDALVGLIERARVERAMAGGADHRALREAMTPLPHTIDAAGLLALTQGGSQAGDEIERLFSAIQTEFQAQVQGLLAMTERLARQHLGSDAQAQVSSIRATGESLLRLHADAKDMLQARRGRLELEPRSQALRALMDEVQQRWQVRAAETGVSMLISYDGDPDLCALVDADRLTQVFDNLIDNALRYTRQGSVEAALRARLEDGLVQLEGRVRDTGPGVSAAKLDALFDGGDGAALPLSLTRGIVLGMGGQVRAESNLGQGMTVIFTLAADAVGEPVANTEQRSTVAGPHVLVVDDNATNRMVAEALCEMFDCTSETAEDGVEAVEVARSGRFDLILMDIKMPRMDGIAATRAIRALEDAAAGVPIVALTANVDPEDARSYLAAGMCCVVEKPIKPERLLQAINTALASGAGAGEAQRVAAA